MEMIHIALPKGRLGEKVYARFKAAGYPCPAIEEENRKLIFENPEAGVCYFWVKPSDVAIYVERGAAPRRCGNGYRGLRTYKIKDSDIRW